MNRTEINVFICDDDELNLNVNKSLVESLGKKHNVDIRAYSFNEFNNEANKLLKNNQIDIAILDVELQVGDGISIAKRINCLDPEIPIIFVTSYKKYKSSAWDVMAMGFIEKPTDTEKFELLFLRALTLAKTRLSRENARFLSINVDKKPIELRIENIIFAEKILRKVNFKTKRATYSAGGTLKQYENKMTPNFLKISQSVMVNKRYIETIDSYSVYLSTGEEFTIGRTFKDKVKKYSETMEQ